MFKHPAIQVSLGARDPFPIPSPLLSIRLSPIMHILGATPVQSVRNLHQWLDALVSASVKAVGEVALVTYKRSQRRVPGVYHQMRQANMEGTILSFDEWTRDCIVDNVSAGTYLSIEGAGRGQCEITRVMRGILKSELAN